MTNPGKPLAAEHTSGGYECLILPLDQLIPGRWYVGRGRNSNLGYWDGEYFVVLAQGGIKTGPGPRDWRTEWQVKYEDYFTPECGCFQPFRLVDEGADGTPLDEMRYFLTVRFSAEAPAHPSE